MRPATFLLFKKGTKIVFFEYSSYEGLEEDM